MFWTVAKYALCLLLVFIVFKLVKTRYLIYKLQCEGVEFLSMFPALTDSLKLVYYAMKYPDRHFILPWF